MPCRSSLPPPALPELSLQLPDDLSSCALVHLAVARYLDDRTSARPKIVVAAVPDEPPLDAAHTGTVGDQLQEITPLHRQSTSIDEGCLHR
jgi:hypothetical protein